ncbi:MAG: glutamate-5-semialdehyde dehydrogenase [Deltaproteobacteria bacterium]|nr:glutamate-5-semialdehyde dehydrogenase [Deltaproteobacteria bacterium]MBN2671488.1 glutamate-5-semialdehyde dehydrogenase [Deltaproteobacteria bacterium]
MNTIDKAMAAKQASFKLASISDQKKTGVILRVAELLKEKQAWVLAENQKDLEKAKAENISQVMYKRLVLTEEKIDGIIASLKDVAGLPDPVGHVTVKRELDDDLILEKVSVPIGVIGIIFESRPDALVQISSLCIKSGNAAILKGGREAQYSNRALFSIFIDAMAEMDSRFTNCLQLVESREDISELLSLDQYVDLMIPRGSNDLVKHIQANTKIPVMGHADGICHVYVDKDADLDMAVTVSVDSKCQYPAVCNAMETLLVHRDIASKFLPKVAEKLVENNVELRGDEATQNIVSVIPATEEDWKTEYTDLILSIRVVDSTDAAIEHINTYGSHHTDAIISKDAGACDAFLATVDSSSVLTNCSTRFADGFRYGLGAEVGISTNKIHARGPVGLEGLLIYKYRLVGNGNIVADYASGKKAFTHKEVL